MPTTYKQIANTGDRSFLENLNRSLESLRGLANADESELEPQEHGIFYIGDLTPVQEDSFSKDITTNTKGPVVTNTDKLTRSISDLRYESGDESEDGLIHAQRTITEDIEDMLGMLNELIAEQ